MIAVDHVRTDGFLRQVDMAEILATFRRNAGEDTFGLVRFGIELARHLDHVLPSVGDVDVGAAIPIIIIVLIVVSAIALTGIVFVVTVAVVAMAAIAVLVLVIIVVIPAIALAGVVLIVTVAVVAAIAVFLLSDGERRCLVVQGRGGGHAGGEKQDRDRAPDDRCAHASIPFGSEMLAKSHLGHAGGVPASGTGGSPQSSVRDSRWWNLWGTPIPFLPRVRK